MLRQRGWLAGCWLAGWVGECLSHAGIVSTIIIIIIRLYGLSKQLAFIAQLVAIHEFIQSGLEALQ